MPFAFQPVHIPRWAPSTTVRRGWLRLVAQNAFDLLHHVRRQLGDDLRGQDEKGRALGSTKARTGMAPKFSLSCSGLVAPRITVETFGLAAAQARASCETVQPNFSEAYFVSSLTIAISFWPSSLLSFSLESLKNDCSLWKREPSGTPSLYLPVRMPDAPTTSACRYPCSEPAEAYLT